MWPVSKSTNLTSVWAEVERELPAGWTLDGLRCASTGLSPDRRSDDWIAVAVGPEGEERTYRANEPDSALRGLAMTFE